MTILLCSSKWIIESSQTISIRRFVPVGVESRPHYVQLICCNVLRHWKGHRQQPLYNRSLLRHQLSQRQEDTRRTFYDDEVFCLFVFLFFFTTLAALCAGNENTGRKGNLRVVAPERKSSSVHESSFRFPGPVISGAFFRRFSFRIYISRPVPNNVSSLHRLLIVFLSPLLLLFLLRSRNNSVVLTRRIELQQHGIVLLCGVASRRSFLVQCGYSLSCHVSAGVWSASVSTAIRAAARRYARPGNKTKPEHFSQCQKLSLTFHKIHRNHRIP